MTHARGIHDALVAALADTEERLTRTAVDQRDIAALVTARAVLAMADPTGKGKRFVEGARHA